VCAYGIWEKGLRNFLFVENFFFVIFWFFFLSFSGFFLLWVDVFVSCLDLRKKKTWKVFFFGWKLFSVIFFLFLSFLLPTDLCFQFIDHNNEFFIHWLKLKVRFLCCRSGFAMLKEICNDVYSVLLGVLEKVVQRFRKSRWKGEEACYCCCSEKVGEKERRHATAVVACSDPFSFFCHLLIVCFVIIFLLLFILLKKNKQRKKKGMGKHGWHKATVFFLQLFFSFIFFVLLIITNNNNKKKRS
jgi:hypothetical protein